ncbi:zeta-crystallin [Leptodontidium sp. 2 PMI_412]|nr:zeta-crystallin [Leptodontidium sp. 2 PMI_412]
MKAIRIDKFVDKIEDIRISEIPVPEPKDGEVLVQIEAAGVNFVDLLYARGKHQNNRSLVTPPFTLGLEFAGTVLSSPISSPFKPGSRVFGGSLGSYASQISVNPTSLQFIPQNWTFAQAAGLAATAPVSYGALILRGRLQRNETILIHASAGGLGLSAIQIAKAAGARVIATSSSLSKLSIARQFGADECINYSSPDWIDTVLKLTQGRGVNVVFDPVGLVDGSLKCLRQRGRVLVVGFAGMPGGGERIAMNRVLLRQAQIIGYVRTFSIPNTFLQTIPIFWLVLAFDHVRYGETDRIDPAETAQIWRELKVLWEEGKFKPTVYDEEYRGLESVVRAMKDLESRKVWGKAVIVMDDGDRPKL